MVRDDVSLRVGRGSGVTGPGPDDERCSWLDPRYYSDLTKTRLASRQGLGLESPGPQYCPYPWLSRPIGGVPVFGPRTPRRRVGNRSRPARVSMSRQHPIAHHMFPVRPKSVSAQSPGGATGHISSFDGGSLMALSTVPSSSSATFGPRPRLGRKETERRRGRSIAVQAEVEKTAGIGRDIKPIALPTATVPALSLFPYSNA
eukprot:TRINITY_DN12072_c0_g1_i1.p1 TRINITY_DN12072_c0_g1~~TRINITY_DN12072_c0_g1_i1.p1  ORF type:complete len:202 (-),score=6.97 TRINITY_DN12072_c0_g1_i1:487-1092(-)